MPTLWLTSPCHVAKNTSSCLPFICKQRDQHRYTKLQADERCLLTSFIISIFGEEQRSFGLLLLWGTFHTKMLDWIGINGLKKKLVSMNWLALKLNIQNAFLSYVQIHVFSCVFNIFHQGDGRIVDLCWFPRKVSAKWFLPDRRYGRDCSTRSFMHARDKQRDKQINSCWAESHSF